jgi:hypothetical protein
LLPTWGKLIVAALSYGVHGGAMHIVIAPLKELIKIFKMSNHQEYVEV